MTTDELITLASIIEKEADTVSDMKMVSGIFHNRLNKGMRIQADSTGTYCVYCRPMDRLPMNLNTIIIHTAARVCPQGPSATRVRMR
jgi:cell division protein YceG involved in septum cleavage